MAPMRTGKLSISRGYQFGDGAAPAPRLVLVPRSADPPPPPKPARAAGAAAAVAVSEEYRSAHDRLTALERLARLAKQGALSADAFAAEKARVLNHAADELVLREPAPLDPIATSPPPRPARGPSLLARLSWRLLPVGLVGGLGLSFASQPQETLHFFDEALRLLGV